MRKESKSPEDANTVLGQKSIKAAGKIQSAMSFSGSFSMCQPVHLCVSVMTMTTDSVCIYE